MLKEGNLCAWNQAGVVWRAAVQQALKMEVRVEERVGVPDGWVMLAEGGL